MLSPYFKDLHLKKKHLKSALPFLGNLFKKLLPIKRKDCTKFVHHPAVHHLKGFTLSLTHLLVSETDFRGKEQRDIVGEIPQSQAPFEENLIPAASVFRNGLAI